jgi:tryptophan halogenase
VTGPIRTVAVIGRDAAAWIAGAALKHAFGPVGIDVQVVELPSLLQAPDVYATVPSIRGLHRLLGIDEDIIIKACNAVPMVGQRFSNWSEAAPPLMHAFENEVASGVDLSFFQYWLKGRIEGLKVDLSHFGVGSAAAYQGRVPLAGENADSSLSAGFGFHLDAKAYASLLKQFSLHLGVSARAALSVEVKVKSDRIRAVILDDGTRIEADLFIDASGSEALLLGQLSGAEFAPWRQWFPADRILAASAPPLPELPAFSQISAIREGWVGLFPLRNRTAIVAVYDSSLVSDQDLLETIPVVARMPVGGDAVVAPIAPGMQNRPWIGNCVAIGEAAVTVEPLDAVQIHLAHAFVSHLINLFPADKVEMPEAQAFNREVGRLAENVRDFQLAHYSLNRRFNDPLWNRARDAGVPETLGRKLSLFKRRGIVPIYDDESFHEWNWAEIFIGHGLMPDDYDPRIDAIPDEEHVARVQNRMRSVAQYVRAMPSVNEVLSSVAGAPQEDVNV